MNTTTRLKLKLERKLSRKLSIYIGNSRQTQSKMILCRYVSLVLVTVLIRVFSIRFGVRICEVVTLLLLLLCVINKKYITQKQFIRGKNRSGKMRKSSSPPLILLSKKSKAPLMHDFEDQFNSRIENIHNSFSKQLHN